MDPPGTEESLLDGGCKAPGFRNPRSLILAALSVLLLAGFLSLPAERLWLGHFLGYFGEFGSQVADCRLDSRLRATLRLNYTIPTDVAGQLRPGDVFLLPPEAYVTARMGREQSLWAEPKYFYSMVGPVRTVTPDDPRVREATCSILLESGGHLHFARISGERELDAILRDFAGTAP